MILLFLLFLTPATSTSSIEDYVSQNFRETISQSSNSRTVWDIIWSCLATVLACTWSAMHLNIPGPYDSGWRNLKRRVVMTFYALIAPELLTLWAFRQYVGARTTMKDYNKTLAKRELPKQTRLESIKNWFLSLPPENNGQGREPWTMSHGFFVQMGGFLLYDDGKPVQVLNYERLKQYINDGIIDTPDITAEEIQDRSKGDFISKGLVVLQTSWFILQCIARWSQKLPLSKLEVVTLAFAILNGIMYALWWHKPQGVGKAFRVVKKHPKNITDNLKVPLVETEKEAAGSKTVEPLKGGPVVQTPTDAVAHRATPVNDPAIVLLPLLPSSKDAPVEAIDDDGNQGSNNVLPGDSMEAGIPGLLPEYRKVTFMQKKLGSNYSKIHGSWTGVLCFYGIFGPFFFFLHSFADLLKILYDQEIEEGALRVSIFRADELKESVYVATLCGSCAIGILFGSVHFIAWRSFFLTPTEQLLWRISTAYITGGPAFLLSIAMGAGQFPENRSVKGVLSALLLFLYNALVFLFIVGTLLYSLSRFFIIFEAVLSLRNLPAAVYQDVEWTAFIPHL